MYAITILDLFINYHKPSKKAITFLINKELKNKFPYKFTATMIFCTILIYPRNNSINRCAKPTYFNKVRQQNVLQHNHFVHGPTLHPEVDSIAREIDSIFIMLCKKLRLNSLVYLLSSYSRLIDNFTNGIDETIVFFVCNK